MAQISRPVQIALAVVALFAIVWVVALHRPGGSSSAAKASAEQAVAESNKASAAKSAATAPSAPGVAGLTKDIAKAHGAVAASQQNAKQLEQKSAQASSSAAPSASSTTLRVTKTAVAPAKTVKVTKSVTVSKSVPSGAAAAPSLARQHLVEAELKQGRVVVLLFWNPKGADDVADAQAVRQLAAHDHGIAVHVSAPSQVASFGSVTRGIQVYGTPTVLIVGKSGQTLTLTGLQDAYAIQQSISLARHP